MSRKSPSAPNPRPVLVICMGVSGTGKSTLARALADAYGWRFVEGDAFHGAANRAHMAAGRPLDDRMRDPWIARICAHLTSERRQGRNCALACSGLRRAHRQRFRELGYRTLFLYLEADAEVIARRVAGREGHYMPLSLLESQFADLQAPDSEPDVVTVSAEPPPEEVAEAAGRHVRRFLEQADRDDDATAATRGSGRQRS